MKLVTMKCPNCAAQMQAQPDAQTARCEYCGTTAAVQRRTRFLERVMPPQVQFQQMPVVTMPHTKGWATRIIVIVVLSLGVSIALPIIIQSHVASTIRSATNAATSGTHVVSGGSDYRKQYQWQGMETIMLADVDGDGTKDIVGRARYVGQEDGVSVAAWTTKNGKQLWESPRYGNYNDTYQGLLALAGDAVLATDTRGKVTAFNLADGAQRWQASVGEKVKRVCAAGDDAVAIELADETWKRLALADGAASGYDGTDDCAPVWTDVDGGNPNLPMFNWHADYIVPDGFDGISLGNHAYIRPDGPFLGLGHKAKGTRVPMLAVYDGELVKQRRGHRRKGKFDLVWSTEIPAGDPFAVDEGAPEHVAFDSDRIYVVYEMKDNKEPHRVAAFNLADGARLWDAPLSPGSGLVLEGMNATPDRVMVSMWGRLEALDAATGKKVFAIGSR